ncbi:MAG TPA: hypothetical protein VIU12_24905, partial [Chryseolinea sp.]
MTKENSSAKDHNEPKEDQLKMVTQLNEYLLIDNFEIINNSANILSPLNTLHQNKEHYHKQSLSYSIALPFLGDSEPAKPEKKRYRSKYVSTYWLPVNLFPSKMDALLVAHGFQKWNKPVRLRKLLWFISRISVMHKRGKIPNGFWVPINREELHYVVFPRFTEDVKTILLEIGIIEINHNYLPASRTNGTRKPFPKSYRLTEEYRQKEFHLVDIGWNEHETKDDNFEINTHLKKKPIYYVPTVEEQQLTNNLDAVYIDLQEYDDLIENLDVIRPDLNQADLDGRMVSIINDHRLWEDGKNQYRSGKVVNRLYSGFTQMCKELRRIIRFKETGERLVELDVKTAQPMFLIGLYPDMHCPEAMEYRESLKRDIYTMMGPDILRKTSKKHFGIYAFGKQNLKWGQNFAREFPILAAEIAKAKMDDVNLSVKLQNQEADVILGNLCECARQHGLFLLTVHDAVAVLEKDVEVFTDLLKGV